MTSLDDLGSVNSLVADGDDDPLKDNASVRSNTQGSRSSGRSAEADLIRQISRRGWVRNAVFQLTLSNWFNNVILAVILLNTVVLSLETVDSMYKTYGWYLTAFDNSFLGIYMLEAILKLYSWQWSYFKSAWNVFDLVIVIISIVTWLIPYFLATAISFNVRIFRLFRLFRAVKAIRSLRVLRTISFLHSLQVIISTVFKSIPAMGNIVLLAGITLYMFAVIGTVCFRNVDPRRFGSLGPTLFRLFQLMTLDHWSDIYRQNEDAAPGLYVYVLAVILLETFVFLNLFIAVIVNNLQSARRRIISKRRKRKESLAVGAGGGGGEHDFFDPSAAAAAATSASGPGDGIGDSQSTLRDADGNELLLNGGMTEESSGIDNYYSPTLPSSTKSLISQYYMLLASLEVNQLMYQKQQQVLDELVDLSKEK